MPSHRPAALVLDQNEDGIFVLFNGSVYLVEDPPTPEDAIQNGQMVHVTITERGTIADLEPFQAVEHLLDPRLEEGEILVKVRVTQRNTYRYPVSSSVFLQTHKVRRNTERLFWSPEIGYVTDGDNQFPPNVPQGFYSCTIVLSFNLDLFYKEDDLDKRNCVSPGLLLKAVKKVIGKCEEEIKEVEPWKLERLKLDYVKNTLTTQRNETRIGIVIAVHKFFTEEGKRGHRSFLWNLEFGGMPIRESKGMPLPQVGETYTFFNIPTSSMETPFSLPRLRSATLASSFLPLFPFSPS